MSKKTRLLFVVSGPSVFAVRLVDFHLIVLHSLDSEYRIDHTWEVSKPLRSLLGEPLGTFTTIF